MGELGRGLQGSFGDLIPLGAGRTEGACREARRKEEGLDGGGGGHLSRKRSWKSQRLHDHAERQKAPITFPNQEGIGELVFEAVLWALRWAASPCLFTYVDPPLL